MSVLAIIATDSFISIIFHECYRHLGGPGTFHPDLFAANACLPWLSLPASALRKSKNTWVIIGHLCKKFRYESKTNQECKVEFLASFQQKTRFVEDCEAKFGHEAFHHSWRCRAFGSSTLKQKPRNPTPIHRQIVN